MTALVAMDSMLLANLSSQIGRHEFAAELTSRWNTLYGGCYFRARGGWTLVAREPPYTGEAAGVL